MAPRLGVLLALDAGGRVHLRTSDLVALAQLEPGSWQPPGSQEGGALPEQPLKVCTGVGDAGAGPASRSVPRDCHVDPSYLPALGGGSGFRACVHEAVLRVQAALSKDLRHLVALCQVAAGVRLQVASTTAIAAQQSQLHCMTLLAHQILVALRSAAPAPARPPEPLPRRCQGIGYMVYIPYTLFHCC